MKEYIHRTYRNWMKGEDLIYFHVSEEESDLYIGSLGNLSDLALKSLKKYRKDIRDYISEVPEFKTSLIPLPLGSSMSPVVRDMTETSSLAGVGPMAAVAGAIAERVARDLLPFSEEVIVENGGDLYLAGKKMRKIGIFAGESSLSGRLAIALTGEELPLAVATSSGTVGPSLSFGKADAVLVLSSSGALADASATALGNLVSEPEDFEQAIEKAKEITGIRGVIIICKEKICIWGDVRLLPVTTQVYRNSLPPFKLK
ncbi:MAG TPA: UPF0280 family protein [Candidatus Eremiobacteraeota bacterium]|nr:MAG: hypothetical protein BWY64_03868 [bacterium ADurb.Bin363]HPZ10713.1 UPF0280 family protein [Candidatus Eremiobacteraeota bacterium]